MSQLMITSLVVVTMMVLFIWNKLPAAIVAVFSSLVLYFTGVLNAHDTLAGFGDSLVVFIAALLVIGTGLEATGVGTWAGQLLIRYAGTNKTLLLVSLLLLSALFTALIGMNGAVVTMVPIAVVIAARTDIAPSQIMMPVSIACLTGAKLTLLGSPVNVIASNAGELAGAGPIRFFEWAIVGVPLFAGAMVIILIFGPHLLPKRRSGSLPVDLSGHAHTLVEQYRIKDDMHHLRVRASSPYVGMSRTDIDLTSYPGVSIVSLVDAEGGEPTQKPVAEGDLLLVRGDAQTVGKLARDMHLAIRKSNAEDDNIADTLFNRSSGLAEIVVPPRSALIGQTVFPGMATHNGDLIILGIQRGGYDVESNITQLRIGDHLLLQGTWEALDKHLSDPQVLVVDSPEVVRRQAVALSRGAYEAIGILILLVVLLTTNAVPPAIAAVLCAGAMVVMRVITLPQLYRGVDWNTCILIGGLIPMATAMTNTGLAGLIGDHVIQLVGAGGPRAVLAGLFVVSTALTQVISNTSAALVMIPIAVATAGELSVSPLPLLIAVAMGSGAAHLTPMSTPVNLVTYGPGAYEFGDYWKLGMMVLLWSLVVAVFIAPLYWRF
ncbi:citrate transporter [Edaphobacter aggregans]|uniref:Citrate transporter n=2 Tax=Edaphobacter aggregans TaxID=570835 RepID=A0A3R9NY62_9BACT|nr:citrate transporter [Edaphobacter aggregans]